MRCRVVRSNFNNNLWLNFLAWWRTDNTDSDKTSTWRIVILFLLSFVVKLKEYFFYIWKFRIFWVEQCFVVLLEKHDCLWRFGDCLVYRDYSGPPPATCSLFLKLFLRIFLCLTFLLDLILLYMTFCQINFFLLQNWPYLNIFLFTCPSIVISAWFWVT